MCGCCLEEALFLDIDGVMSKCEFGKDLYSETYGEQCTALHRPSVVALKMLLDRHPATKIVWISSWAYGENPYASQCVISPLDVLEMYPWLKDRTYGRVEKAASGHVEDSIVSFLRAHPTKSFAILDDNSYAYLDVDDSDIRNWLKQHYVQIDPEKAFAASDISRIEEVLEFPMAGRYLHYLLADLDANDMFVINGRYKCSFDFFKHKSGKIALLPWTKNPMCLRREECSIDVNAYDMEEGKMLVCQIVLARDNDLHKSSRYSAAIYSKDNVTGRWKSGTNVFTFEYC